MKLGQCARLVLLSGALSGTAGCLSMGTVQTASTLGKGNFQISAEPGFYGYSIPRSGAGGGGGSGGGIGGVPAGPAPEVVPHFDVAFRYGASDRFDIGVRVGWTLLEVQTKILFTDPEAQRLAISLAPTLGGAFLGTTTAGGTSATSITGFNLAVPLLFGIKHFRANELVFGPRINNLLFLLRDSTGSAGVYTLAIGGTVGYAFAIGEIFKILPEFAISVPVISRPTIGRAALAEAGYGEVVWQVKVGLMFGRTGKRAPEPLPPPPPMPPPEPMSPPPPPPLPAVPISDPPAPVL